jgi:cytochrome c oxidase cbb3-type subunit I/II
VYDHPFLWGSKRTGPDLHRVGGKYPDSWHFLHMRTPAETSPGSIMPGYPWLYRAALDTSHTEGKIIALRRLGVPYQDGFEHQAVQDLRAQAARLATDLRAAGQPAEADREIIALIAYLQRLGTDVKKWSQPQATAAVEGGR